MCVWRRANPHSTNCNVHDPAEALLPEGAAALARDNGELRGGRR